MKVYSWH
ncbi:hypothetical protein CGLO_14642 [Colletotrichum gloeosporioides Cg-14]|nr:hypothetical protein CGLO_14642 [Colletotrichum gloeosporioides Cg-14]